MKKFIFTKCFILIDLIVLVANSLSGDFVFGIPFLALVLAIQLIVIFAIDFSVYKFFGQKEEGLLKIRKWSIVLFIFIFVLYSLFIALHNKRINVSGGSESIIQMPLPTAQ
jgi:hypothetical protein